MGAFLAFLISPLGKLAREAALVLGLVAAGWFLLQQHDANVLSAQNLVTEKAVAATQAAQAGRTIATLQRENSEAEAETTVVVTAKRNIANAPDQSGCPDPAVRAALDGLHTDTGGRHITHPKAAR
jgi:hypothetical protein